MSLTELTKEKRYSVSEAAKALSVHRHTVRNWVSKGLPHMRTPSGRIYFTERQLLEVFTIQNGVADDDC